MNNISLTGIVGSEPELRYTPQGTPVLSFSMSLYTGGSKESGYKPSVWVNVKVWDGYAVELNDTIRKGQRVTIDGIPCPPRVYKNREGVEVKAGLEVSAKEVKFLSPKEGAQEDY